MYLWRDPKSGVYKYRREYPVNVREHVGKRWFVQSLKTKDKVVADRLYADANLAFEQVIDQYHLHQYIIPADLKPSLLFELKQRAIFHKPDITFPELLESRAKLELRIQHVRSHMQIKGDDCDVFSSATKGYVPAQQMLSTYSDVLHSVENVISLSKGGKAPSRQLIAIEQPSYVTPDTKLQRRQINHGVLPKLSDALEKWITLKKPQHKTITDWRFAVRRFTELFGDLPVDSITRSMCVEYRDMMAELPIIKSHKLRKLSITQIHDMFVAGDLSSYDDYPSNRTVNKYLDGLSSVIQLEFNKSDAHAYLHNPTSKLALSNKAKYKRVGLSEKDLKLLLNAPIFTGSKCPAPYN